MQEHKEAVRNFAKEGFRVLSVSSYHTPADDASGKNIASTFTDRVWMTTPYVTPAGRPLLGTCEVRHLGLGGGVENGMSVSGVELFVSRDGVTPMRGYTDTYLPDKKAFAADRQGRTSPFSEVERKVSGCAVSTLFFPHVLKYEEYMGMKMRENAVTGLLPPTEENYVRYLEHCRRDMKEGGQYVGEVTDPGQVDMLLTDTPGFQAGMEEYNKSCGGPGPEL